MSGHGCRRDRTRRRIAPTQERARASVDAILIAAEQVLLEEGFDRATTNRIAARAGVNIALVYRYFAGKEAIVGALIERAARTTHDAVRTALAENASAPLPTAIRALLDALVSTPGLHPTVHRLLVEHVEVAKRDHVVHELRAMTGRLFSEFLVSRSDELRPIADRDAALFVLQHAVEAAAHATAFYRPDGMVADRALEALLDLVLRALVPIDDGEHRGARPAS